LRSVKKLVHRRGAETPRRQIGFVPEARGTLTTESRSKRRKHGGREIGFVPSNISFTAEQRRGGNAEKNERETHFGLKEWLGEYAIVKER
jgi:hypothetical protein